MSGILYNKQRILDTLVTTEGRRQIASGKFRPTYVSFTDGTTFYESDLVSGSSDAGSRVFLEATSLPQDQIVFESDDSGQLVMSKHMDGGIGVVDGRIVTEGGTASSTSFVTGSTFAASASVVLKGIHTHFARNMMIGTRDPFDEETEFELDGADSNGDVGAKVDIYINDAMVNDNFAGMRNVSLDALDTLLFDNHVSHTPNAKYLPPVNSVKDSKGKKIPFGCWPCLSKAKPLSPTNVLTDLNKWKKWSKDVTFARTSKQGNLICQFFQITPWDVTKLDVIEYGQFTTGAGSGKMKHHVFFVGKLFQNGYGAHVFVKIFTLMFTDY